MEKHKALVMGRVEKKRYYFVRDDGYRYFGYGRSKIKTSGEFLEHKEIWNGELENPPLENNDFLYITDINKKVKVTDKAKSTDGGYIYWTNFVEYIEDEETELTKLNAENAKNEWEEYLEKRNQEDKEKSIKEFKQEITKRWWQFWK